MTLNWSRFYKVDACNAACFNVCGSLNTYTARSSGNIQWKGLVLLTWQTAPVERREMDPRYMRFNQYVGITSCGTTGRRPLSRLASEKTIPRRSIHSAPSQRAEEIAFVEITRESFNLPFERLLTWRHEWLLIRGNDRFTVL